MTRRRLRKVLVDAGVPVGRLTDGACASIVEYVDWWGVQPGIPGSGADTPDIKRALDAAAVPWQIANVIMVKKG